MPRLRMDTWERLKDTVAEKFNNKDNDNNSENHKQNNTLLITFFW